MRTQGVASTRRIRPGSFGGIVPALRGGAMSVGGGMLCAIALLGAASCSLGFDDEYEIYQGDGAAAARDAAEPSADAARHDAMPEAGRGGDAAMHGGEGGPGDSGEPADAACVDGEVLDAGGCVPDACAAGPCGNNASCALAAGSPGYVCTCDAGYELDGDACVDIDECFEGTYDCHLSATCENSDGGYDCACPLGYVGGGRDGVACTPRIVAGNAHVCAVLTSGRVQCWGSNAGGALGDGTEIDRTEPVMVVALEDVVGMAAYGAGNCAIVAGGQVACWGKEQLEAQTVPELEGAIALSTCSGHSCAVQRDGAVRCWGQNDVGQLGSGEMTVGEVLTPATVDGLSAPAIAVHVIDRQSCVVLQGGDVQCWGDGMLGNQMYTSSLVPVDAVTGNVIALTSGGYHWCALLGSRQLDCWGNEALIGGSSGFTAEPRLMSGVSNVSAVQVQVYRTHALLGDHTIRWWDAGTAPAMVPGVTDAVAVAVGNRLACALLEDGTVTCWSWVNPGDVPAPMAMPGVDLW